MRRLYYLLLIMFLPVMLFAQDLNVTQLEYFFNTDPGFGQGTPIQMTAGSSVSVIPALNTSGLSPGFQNLYVRAKIQGGFWGPYETKVVYVGTNNEVDDVVEIVALEYYFDQDPGFGAGTSIDITSGTSVSLNDILSTDLLTNGFHNLYLRGKTIQGYWGPYETKVVYVNTEAQINTVVEIVGLEYFFDEDPGFGQGTAIDVFQSLSVDLESNLITDGLTTGFHNLYIRGKMLSGAWGAYETRVIYVDTEASIDAVVEITELEYFFDADPGFGQGTSINITQGLTVELESALTTSSLTTGFHNLYLRGKMANGTWGAYENRVIYIAEQQTEPILINQVEFFVDTDPGFGQGQVVSFQSVESAEKTIEVITSSLSLGPHKIYMRSRSDNLSWGPYEVADVTIYPDVLSENFETGLPATLTTGDITLSSGVWSATNIIQEQTIVIGSNAARLSMQNGELIAPFFSAVSNSSFYYALPAAGTQQFKVLASIDEGAFEEIGSITATSTTYQEYTYELNQPGSTARIKIQTDVTTGSDQDLLIDDFLSASLDGVDIVKLYPRNGGANVQLDSTFVIVFNQQVIKGTGNFYVIDKADDSVVETIALSEVTLVGDSAYFNPTLLQYSKSYAVTIDAGTFTKPDGTLPFVGILNNNTWSFETFIPPPVISITGAGAGFTFTDVDAASKTAATSTYQVTGENLVGNISLTVTSDNGLGTHPGFDISLTGTSYSTSATILSTEATNKDVVVRAIVPANNGRSYSGKIIHNTSGGGIVEIPVAVTELYQESTVAISSPAEGTTFIPGTSVNLQWATTNMSNEPLIVSYSTDGVDFTPVNTTISNVTSYSVNTTGFPEGTYYLMIAAPNLPVPVSDTITVNLQNADATIAPTDIFALENINGTVTFSWIDNSSTETGYRIEYSSNNTDWQTYTTNVGANVQTYTTPTIGVGLAYWWRVVAFNASSTAASVSKFAGRITSPGRALSFDGIDDYVTIPDTDDWTIGTNDFTFEFWFKANDLTGTPTLITQSVGSASSGSSFYIGLNYNGEGSISLYTTTGTGWTDQLHSDAGLITTDRWYHVAFTRDNSGANIYLEGQPVLATGTVAANIANGTRPIEFGVQNGTIFFNGEIDEFGFWNVARTENEISSNLYNTLKGNESGLIAYYRFDQSGSSDVLPDRTVNNLNGTVINGASGSTTPSWVASQALTQIIPSLTVISPNGGQTYNAYQEVEITWSEANLDPADSIYINLIGSTGTNLLAKGTVESFGRSYVFSVPNTSYCCSLIEIVNITKGVSDRSNSGFGTTISPEIILTFPNGGEVLEGGTGVFVSWTPVGFGGGDIVDVNISLDNGVTYNSLVSGNFLNGANIPLPAENTTTALIAVKNIQRNVSDTSDAPFTIQLINRTIEVLTPNGGETWQGGTTQTISWSTENIDENDFMEVRLSTNNGQNFSIIADGRFSTYPDNSFQWTVPDQPTTEALISVVNTSRTNISDTGDAPFTIIPAADLTAPSFNSQPLVFIGNQNVDITVNLNEAGTVYYVGLADGSSIPTATQIKDITPQTPLEGQLIAGSFTYNEPNIAQSVSGTGAFIIGSIYDFYFTAEDAEGNLNEGFSRPNVEAIRVYTPLEQDSIVLINMYNAMGGETWVNLVNDWTVSPITDWAEVSINERVTAVNLSGKGLIGDMPTNVSQLIGLQSFDVSNNEITSVPSFAEVGSLTTLNISNNRLSFVPIINNLSVEGLVYDPQKAYGDGPVYERVLAASNKTLFAPFLGPNVVYEWRFGELIPGQFFNNNVQELSGGLVQNYTIQNINASNQGTYRFFATHPSLPGFVIQGRNQNILAITDIKGTIRSNGSPIAGGELFIYRQTPEGPFAKEDSTLVQSNGTYSLIGVVLGNFIIQVKPNRDNNPTAIQTYYISAETYEEADVLILDSKKENIDIDLVFYEPGNVNPQGATIGGTLESELEDPPTEEGNRISSRRKVKKAGCAMRRFKVQGRDDQDDVETEIAYYIETDDEGYFNFENVDYGRYLINIQFPGVPMNPDSDVEFFIDPDKENQVFEVNALITELGIDITANEILFNWKPYLKDVVLYPNPTEGKLAMDYTVYRNINDLKIQVHNVSGRLLKTQIEDHEQGRHHAMIDLTDYASGIYFLILTDSEGTFQQQLKVTRK